jgi:hypothetical protein
MDINSRVARTDCTWIKNSIKFPVLVSTAAILFLVIPAIFVKLPPKYKSFSSLLKVIVYTLPPAFGLKLVIKSPLLVSTAAILFRVTPPTVKKSPPNKVYRYHCLSVKF